MASAAAHRRNGFRTARSWECPECECRCRHQSMLRRLVARGRCRCSLVLGHVHGARHPADSDCLSCGDWCCLHVTCYCLHVLSCCLHVLSCLHVTCCCAFLMCIGVCSTHKAGVSGLVCGLYICTRYVPVVYLYRLCTYCISVHCISVPVYLYRLCTCCISVMLCTCISIHDMYLLYICNAMYLYICTCIYVQAMYLLYICTWHLPLNVTSSMSALTD